MTLPGWHPDAAVGDLGGWAWPAPDFTAGTPTPLPPGLEVEIVQRFGNWLLLRAANGWQAWTEQSYIVLAPAAVAAPPGQPAGDPGVTPATESSPQLPTAPAEQPGVAQPTAATSRAESIPITPPDQPALFAHAVPAGFPALPLIGGFVIAGALIGGSVWALTNNQPVPTAGPPLPPGPSADVSLTEEDFEVDLEYTRILGDFDSCRWGRTFSGRDETDLATYQDGSAFGTIRLFGSVGEARVMESNLDSGQLSECPLQSAFDFDQTAQIVSDSRESWSAQFELEQGLTATVRALRNGGRFDLVLELRGGSGPNNSVSIDYGSIAAPPGQPASEEPTDVQQGIFSGEIENARGRFRAGACTWRVTLTGGVEAGVELRPGQVSGDAHVQAHAVTERQAGSPSCSGDEQDWDQHVDVSGTLDDVVFTVIADPFVAQFHGSYDQETQAILGTITVNSTIPDIDGTVTGDLFLIRE